MYDADGSVSMILKFDVYNNRMIKQKNFHEFANTVITFTYNDAGQRIRQATTNYVYRSRSHYVAELHPVSQVAVRGTGYTTKNGVVTHRWRRTYTHDSAWRITSMTETDEHGNLIWRQTFEYDAAGNNIRSAKYGADGLRMWRKEKEHDPTGNMVRAVTHHSNGTRTVDEYDVAGRMIRSAMYSANGAVLVLRQTFEYDVNGNMIRTITYRFTEGIRVVDELNPEGHIIRSTTYRIGR